MKNLSFSYNNEKDVLQNISLQINPGEKVCVRGKDSSGKSTFLRLLAGVYTDFKGSLLLNDVPVGNYDLDSVRSQIGVLINQQDIFHGSVWENISLGNENITLDNVNTIAGKVGLTDFIATLKHGYDTVLDPTGKRLPRSVVQKILLVRALAGHPRLLLLEEPWINFENHQRLQIIQLIKEFKNSTVVIVSNDEEFARECNTIITMNDDGSIITSKS